MEERHSEIRNNAGDALAMPLHNEKNTGSVRGCQATGRLEIPHGQEGEGAMDFRSLLATKGLRHTSGRGEVLRALHAAHRPLTHAEVAERIPDGTLDLASVYRNLVKLAEAGLVTRVECGDHLWLYEVFEDSHPHFLCVDCGAVTCLKESAAPAATTAAGEAASAIGAVLDVLVRGRCRTCLEGAS
jgi:Fur family ferric uptake transcriptional regulator